jgi:hypothetical protein
MQPSVGPPNIYKDSPVKRQYFPRPRLRVTVVPKLPRWRGIMNVIRPV